MAPPQLPADAPVFDVLQPLEPGLLVELGHQLEVFVAHCVNRAFGHVLVVHPPLRDEEGFNDVVGTRTESQPHRVRLVSFEHTHLRQFFNQLIPRVESLQALKLFTSLLVDFTRSSENVNEFEIMFLSTSKVVVIMGRSDFDSSGSKLHVYEFGVQNNGQQAAVERVFQFLAVEVSVAGVVGVHGDCGVPKHGFDSCSGHNEFVRAVLQLLGKFVQHAEFYHFVLAGHIDLGGFVQLNVVHFEVGNGGLEFDAPVYQAVGPEDDALVLHAHEGFLDGHTASVIHSEEEAFPVHRNSQHAELVADAVALLGLPLPHFLEEFLAAEVVLGDAFLHEQLLDYRLGSDPGVIHARHPEHVEALHAFVSDDRVLNRKLQCVAHVETAGHVRRRNQDGLVLFLGSVAFRLVVALRIPPRIPIFFY
mmetsp:Transcript_32794/g.71507  ORF Transcript_32794/g.71507 Transcript_32794/m.71507 type:complete len:419 (-) Transcript_32794:110-1366(-)